jgi:hypothetical protein
MGTTLKLLWRFDGVKHRPPVKPLGWLYEPETFLESSIVPMGALAQLESAVQLGSAAKAVFSLERSCPMSSMAPVLAIG